MSHRQKSKQYPDGTHPIQRFGLVEQVLIPTTRHGYESVLMQPAFAARLDPATGTMCEP